MYGSEGSSIKWLTPILYLIFALFSGLLGTAFSVLIRLELSGPGVQYIADNQLVRRTSLTIYKDYFLYIVSATKLGEGESPEPNTASSQTGHKLINLGIIYVRAALSKVKAILPEVYLIGALFIGPSLARDRTRQSELGPDNWGLTKGHFCRGIKYTLNLGKGLPKGNINGIVTQNFGIAYSPLRVWQRKYHSTKFIYPLHILCVKGNRSYGRVLGKCVSTKTQAADTYVGGIEFNGRSKVDKLYHYCKKQQNNGTNYTVRIKVYNLLYDKNIYNLAYKLLKLESNNTVILTAKNRKELNIFGCSLLYPNLTGITRFGAVENYSNIITQIRAESYKFTDLGIYLSIKMLSKDTEKYSTALKEATLKDTLVLKVIAIILEAIYRPSFDSLPRQVRPSFNHESALKDARLKLKGVRWLIKGDISKSFNKINLNFLMSILDEKVKDKRFTGLI